MVACLQWLKNTSNTKQLLRSETFTTLSSSLVKILLESDDLASSEDKVWEAFTAWSMRQAKDNKSNWKQHLQEHKRAIRFACMDPVYFTKQVLPVDILNKDEQIDILTAMLVPDQKCLFNRTPRHG